MTTTGGTEELVDPLGPEALELPLGAARDEVPLGGVEPVVGPVVGGIPGVPALGAAELGEDVPVRRPPFARSLPRTAALPAARERALCWALDDG
jgi:hypothetical protein